MVKSGQDENPSTRSSSLRERNHERTRQDLLTAGMKLFKEQGYSNTTISDIAKAAGMSRRSFFRYFRSKEDLAICFQNIIWDRSLKLPAESPSGGSLEEFAQYAIDSLMELESDEVFARWIEVRRFVDSDSSLRARYALREYEKEQEGARIIADRTGYDFETDYRPQLWSSLIYSASRTTSTLYASAFFRGDPCPMRTLAEEVFSAAGLLPSPAK